MEKYYVHHNGHNWFVKEEQTFKEQGGDVEPWGRAWIAIWAHDLQNAHAVAQDTFGNVAPLLSHVISTRSVLQHWVQTLPFMQQSVLLSNMRNADGVEKSHPSKDLIRWYRRCVVLSAFDGRALTDPTEPGGGSYTGPVEDIEKAANDFIRARDGMQLHYFAHAMHAFQIVGYKHPNVEIRAFWNRVYMRMVEALHVWPETEEQMDARLGDNIDGWKAREDIAGGCST